MSPLEANPFGLLTFIVAPAILTNASSVMALGTGNRFARTVDRVRNLSAQPESSQGDPDAHAAVRARQLQYGERRALLLVRALTAFYLAVGSFAAASLISLLGAVFFVAGVDVLHQFTLVIAIVAGAIGVSGLVTGSVLLVAETRMALRMLIEETTLVRGVGSGPAEKP